MIIHPFSSFSSSHTHIQPTLGDYRLLLDPICSLLIVGIILATTLPVLQHSMIILLNKTPTFLDLPRLRKAIKQTVPQVLDIHKLHVWNPSNGSEVSGMMHVVMRGGEGRMMVQQDDGDVEGEGGRKGGGEGAVAMSKIRHLMHDAGIHNVTIQVCLHFICTYHHHQPSFSSSLPHTHTGRSHTRSRCNPFTSWSSI